MEQKDNKMKRNIIYAIIFVVVLIIIGIIIAYAYYNVDTVLKNTPTNINGTTDCIEISYEEKDIINLSYQYPISDEYARENVVPVKVTLKNKCTKNIEPLEYTVTFTSLAENTGYIEDDQIKIRVTKEKETKELIKPTTYLTNLTKITTGNAYTVLTEDLNKRTNVSTYPKKTSYIIDTGTIENNKTIEYEVYLWVDYYEGDRTYKGLNDNTTMDQQFAGAISAIVNVGEQDKFKAVEGPGTKLEGSKGLSYEQIGGMYRYQGQATEVDNNYICFGTTDKDDCLKNQDRYLYRIIGITQDGEIKVIKKEALEKTFKWWDNTNEDIKWPDSPIYKAINGEDFLTNIIYVPKGWSEKISTHTWHYGNIQNSLSRQPGLELYKIETGQKMTSWYKKVDANFPGATSSTINDQTIYYVKENGLHKQTISSKISLMYIHDYFLSVNDDTNCQNDENDINICKTGWMHLSQNDSTAPVNFERFMEWLGFYPTVGYFSAFCLRDNGSITNSALSTDYSIRPVFYLSSDITIKETTNGSIGNPYIIE